MLTEASIDFAAGWISGGISVLVCQPLDTVLTRFQAKSLPVSDVKVGKPGGAGATLQISSTIFRSMISNFGVSSLWRGSSAMIGAVPVQNALLMTGYGVGRRWSGSEDDGVLVGVFVGGCTGESFAQLLGRQASSDLLTLRFYKYVFDIRWRAAIICNVPGE
jgi:solute carrier family 25 carnitine/acylcarnitine transporter 20/29